MSEFEEVSEVSEESKAVVATCVMTGDCVGNGFSGGGADDPGMLWTSDTGVLDGLALPSGLTEKKPPLLGISEPPFPGADKTS